MTLEFGKTNALFNGKTLGEVVGKTKLNLGVHREFSFSVRDLIENRIVATQEVIDKAICEQIEKAMELFRNGATEVELTAGGEVIGVLTMTKVVPIE